MTDSSGASPRFRVADVLRVLDARFPLARAASWDKTGLLLGERDAAVERVRVAYEITPEVLAESHRGELLVAYHPLLFRPLEKLESSDPVAALCLAMARLEQSLICLHTALDGAPAPHALGDALARQLGLENVSVGPGSEAPELCLLSVYVPEAAVEEVCQALWSAGAGRLGAYEQASFRVAGEGTFTPMEGASPAIGAVGSFERVAEIRVEVVVPRQNSNAVLAAMRRAHPYETVAFSLCELLNADQSAAFGPLRVGEVAPMPLDDWAREAAQRLGAVAPRLVRSGLETVRRVACTPGSGASFIDALEAGTMLVTGDIKHHDARRAQSRGVAILDVSHAATEAATLDLLSEPLRALAGLTVEISAAPRNPFEDLLGGDATTANSFTP